MANHLTNSARRSPGRYTLWTEPPSPEEIESSFPRPWEMNGSRWDLPVTYVEEKELLAWGLGVLQSRTVLHHLLPDWDLFQFDCYFRALFSYASHPHRRPAFPEFPAMPRVPLAEERFFRGDMMEISSPERGAEDAEISDAESCVGPQG